MSKSLLVVVPSRGRPELCLEMVQSFLETKSKDTRMIIYLNDDDPLVRRYAVPVHPDVIVEIGPKKYIAQVYNSHCVGAKEDYFANLNDDHLFITPQWDEKLMSLCEEKGNGWGIACAEDHLTDWNQHHNPSGCVISGKMTQVLGFIAAPGLRHIGIDVIQARVCDAIGCLFRDPNIIIEHRHWLNGMRPMDNNYRWVYSDDEQGHGDRAVRDYMYGQFNSDIKKLKEAIAAEKK